jgi:acyl-CoA dehydrogenase
MGTLSLPPTAHPSHYTLAVLTNTKQTSHTMFAARGAQRTPRAVAAVGRASHHMSRPTAVVGARAISFDLSEEQQMIQDVASRFARDVIIPAAPALDRSGEFPQEIFSQLHELGLTNCHIPEEYGGPGLDSLGNVIVTEALAYGCTGVSTAVSANDLAQAPVILAGNEEQKKKYLGWCAAEPIQCSYGV